MRRLHGLPELGVLAVVASCIGCAGETRVDEAARLVRAHRTDEAVVVLRAETTRHPDDTHARRLLIRVLGLQGNLDAARVEAAAWGKRLPAGDPAPWIELGHAFELAKRFDDALDMYDRAATEAPASPLGPREGGMRAARWGLPEEARARLEEAVRRGARDAEVFHALGLVLVHLGDLENAGRAYRQGTAADAQGVDNWLGLATLALKEKDAAAALVAYNEIAKRRPRSADAQLGRAWALGQLGRRDEARIALDTAERLGGAPEPIAKQRAALAR